MNISRFISEYNNNGMTDITDKNIKLFLNPIRLIYDVRAAAEPIINSDKYLIILSDKSNLRKINENNALNRNSVITLVITPLKKKLIISALLFVEDILGIKNPSEFNLFEGILIYNKKILFCFVNLVLFGFVD